MSKTASEMRTLMLNSMVYVFDGVSGEFYGGPGWPLLYTYGGIPHAVTWKGNLPSYEGTVGWVLGIVEGGKMVYIAGPQDANAIPFGNTEAKSPATNARQSNMAGLAAELQKLSKDNGSNGSYYEVDCVSHKDGREYVAECQDIIDALQMTFNEGNTFKSLWRLAAARIGKVKGAGGQELYDAQKVEFYGKRVLKAQEAKQ